MDSFLLDNTASEVPDVVKPVETVDKRSGNLYLFIRSSFMCPSLIRIILLIITFNETNNCHLKCVILLSGNSLISQHEAFKKYYLTINKKAVFIGKCYPHDDETLVHHKVSSTLWKIQDKVCIEH